MPFTNVYEPPPLKSKESQELEFAVRDIRNEIRKMLNDDDDDDNIVFCPTSTPVAKKEGDLTLIFVYPPENYQEERILPAGNHFIMFFNLFRNALRVLWCKLTELHIIQKMY